MVPPFLGFGWYQFRWGYKSTKDLEYVLNNEIKNYIPLDGIWTDLVFCQIIKILYYL